MGLRVGDLFGPQKSYEGFGEQKSLGKRAIPIGIELLNPDTVRLLEGSIDSNELGSDGHHMLLSLKAQATLGLVKDVADSTCFAKSWQK